MDQKSFDFWLQGRPKWIQTAIARSLASQKKPTPNDIYALADLAISEAEKCSDDIFEKAPEGIFDKKNASVPLRLINICNIVGVNAIHTESCLEFSDDMTVIYGQNGAGKSGFSRVLKFICGAKTKSDLLPNVFENNPPHPEATVTFSENGVDCTKKWSLATGMINELRHIHVFDNITAQHYINERNEATYEPRKLRFLSFIIWVADAVAAELEKRKSNYPSKLPLRPNDFSGTQAENTLKKLAILDHTGIRASCQWGDLDIQRKTAIENTLKETDAVGKLKEISTKKTAANTFYTSMTSTKRVLKPLQIEQLENAKKDAAVRRKAAYDAAQVVFSSAALEGVGNDSWKALWEQARNYSEEIAYKSIPFPNVDDEACCVLCHQRLDDKTKGRLLDFEDFVKSNLEIKANDAELLLKNLIDQIPKNFNIEEWTANAEMYGMESEEAHTFISNINVHLAELRQPQFTHSLLSLKFDWTPFDGLIDNTITQLNLQENSLLEIQKAGGREALEAELKELKAKEWLHNNLSSILDEATRIKRLNVLDDAIKLANTRALTLKKNELAEEELSRGYYERFLEELKLLGGSRLPVEPTPHKEGKGVISFSLSLKDAVLKAKTPLVLSEGESRIIALAAFLADISGSGEATPFIFDDPITSLDQEFEERVVKRLIELAKNRQVIIFTHRLSLRALIDDAETAIKRKEPSSTFKLKHVTLKRFDNRAGVIDSLDIRHKYPQNAFKDMKNGRLAQLRKLQKEQNEDFDELVKATCSNFRILIERCIEKILLDGVLERFRRGVETKQIKTLAKINIDDCMLIDDYMTKYSTFEHSQSDELPLILPTLDEIENDLNAVIAWIEEFKKRK